jgi:hypothetical protein
MFNLTHPVDVDAEDTNVTSFLGDEGQQMFRLFTEPPHTSNYLQAVDVIAKQVHVAYDKRKKRFLQDKYGKDRWRDGDLTQGDFLSIVLAIWPHWCTKEERQNAFKKVKSLPVVCTVLHFVTSVYSIYTSGWHHSRWT